MVYIPLLLGAKTDKDWARVSVLGLVMVWSFAPLLPGFTTSVVKNLIILAQVFWLH